MTNLPLRRILCPTDFSPLATAAVRYAAGLARSTEPKATLSILYADSFEPPPYFTAAEEGEVAASLKHHKEAAERLLTEYAAEHAGPDADSLVVALHPVEAIRRVALEKGADLIVMGTHGRAGVRRFMLGSVTEGVLATADRPLLTVRGDQEKVEGGAFAVRHILCPVDFSETAREALGYAASLAKSFGAELSALHVVDEESKHAGELARLCSWVPEEVRSGCELKELVRTGNAAEQIVSIARDLSCDLIVLGAAHKRFGDTTVLGSTVVRVTRHASVPVLTVFAGIRKEE